MLQVGRWEPSASARLGGDAWMAASHAARWEGAERVFPPFLGWEHFQEERWRNTLPRKPSCPALAVPAALKFKAAQFVLVPEWGRGGLSPRFTFA